MSCRANRPSHNRERYNILYLYFSYGREIARHPPAPGDTAWWGVARPRSSSVFQHRDSGGRLSRPRPARQLLVELERDRGDWRRPSIHKVTAAAEPISASGATRVTGGLLTGPATHSRQKSLSARNRQSSKRTEAMPRGGIRSTSFKPGVSGNPGGRPKTSQTIEVRRIILGVREAARELTSFFMDRAKRSSFQTTSVSPLRA